MLSIDDEVSRVKTSKDKTTSTTTLTQHSAWLEGERNSLEVISNAGDREIDKGERRGAVHQPDKPVEDPDVAKATQDQGQTATTSTSIQSTSHHHPADMEMTTDPMRPSEDPADMTDDDERHPDEPTQPPDKPEGEVVS